MEKKGLSAIVGTVLMIAIVMIMAGIIFVWGGSFISRLSPPVGCYEVEFEAEITNENGAYFLNLVNLGDISIKGVVVKYSAGGDIVILSDINSEVSPGRSERLELELDGQDKLIIVPKISVIDGDGNESIAVCPDDGSYEAKFREVGVN